MKKIYKFLLSRGVIFGILILIQLGAVMGLVWGVGYAYTNTYIILEFLSFVIAICIINGDRNPSYKLAWLIVMLAVPIFGSIFYLFFGIRHNNFRSKKRMQQNETRCKEYLKINDKINEEVNAIDKNIYRHTKYLTQYSYHPLYKNFYTKYIEDGEKKYIELIKELKNAKKYIFLEYFIIAKGFMWDGILEILENKVKEGIDVRIIYDDFGCLFRLPTNYDKILKSKGIKCQLFNPVVPFINIYMNHRDHRKLAIIDGQVAFIGGMNIADEYMNKIHKFGHWKDCNMVVKGECVWSITVMFLQMWNFFTIHDNDWSIFKPEYSYQEAHDGYIQPFGDIPIDKETITKNAYKNLITSAKRYVYIETPYLIIDNEMIESLTLAAKSGIDVRIICPGIPDKKSIYLVSKAFFPKLIEAGVKIYIYTPGFMHSKLIVVDDEVGILGTANMDYRSFYLHFEAGLWIYKSKVLLDIKEDFLNTLKCCEQLSLVKAKNINIVTKIFQGILRIFSPIM